MEKFCDDSCDKKHNFPTGVSKGCKGVEAVSLKSITAPFKMASIRIENSLGVTGTLYLSKLSV